MGGIGSYHVYENSPDSENRGLICRIQSGGDKKRGRTIRFGQRKGGRPSEWVILGMETFKRHYTHPHKYHPDETPPQHNKYKLVRIHFRKERPRLKMSSFGRKLACHKLSKWCMAVTLTLGT